MPWIPLRIFRISRYRWACVSRCCSLVFKMNSGLVSLAEVPRSRVLPKMIRNHEGAARSLGEASECIRDNLPLARRLFVPETRDPALWINRDEHKRQIELGRHR